MRDQSAPPRAHPPRDIPIVTIALMTTIVLITVVPSFILGFTPPIFVSPDDEGRFGALVFVPPALGLIGAVAAMFYRSITICRRLAWAAISFASGFLALALSWRVLVLLLGP